MVECTSSADTLARVAFGRDNVIISSVKNMVDRFKLDPAISEVAREAFIVTDMDLTRKVKAEFLKKAAAKHKDVIIIYIARRGKTDIQPGNGINAVLINPTPEALADTVFANVEEISQKGSVISSSDTAPEAAKDFTTKENEGFEGLTDEFGNPLEFDFTEPKEETPASVVEETPVEVPVDLTPEPVVEEPSLLEPTDNIIKRVKDCTKVADVAHITRELTATTVIKEFLQGQADYTGIEERLKGLNEKINSVFLDTTIPAQDKNDKIRALLYDKNYYRAKTNTIIEQRVEEIITTITSKTKELLDKRCAELDRAIENCATCVTGTEVDSARIAGLLDDRANIILEIALLREEVQKIYEKMDKLAVDTTANIAEESTVRTGKRRIDARLRLTGDSTVPYETVETIERILSMANSKTEEFKDASRQLILMNQKLLHIMKKDKEIIGALTHAIEILQTNDVEDSILQKTRIKSALRLFVAKPGSGRTVVPYICSKIKSRSNNNVLYIDITGDTKLADYGEKVMDLQDWMSNQKQEQCCVVAGSLTDADDVAQRFLVALTKAADYYRVINVVMTPEQRHIMEVLAPDVLVINYIVDPKQESLDFFANYIRETVYENVGQRVILNKCISSTTSVMLEKLGLVEDMSVHVATIPYEPIITECGLRGVKPYDIQVVQEAFREVSKVC